MRNILINKSKNVSNDKLLELILKVKTNDNNRKELQNLQLIIGQFLLIIQIFNNLLDKATDH